MRCPFCPQRFLSPELVFDEYQGTCYQCDLCKAFIWFDEQDHLESWHFTVDEKALRSVDFRVEISWNVMSNITVLEDYWAMEDIASFPGDIGLTPWNAHKRLPTILTFS
jgi:hypothetical protein